jgi:hypothetical protein
MSLRTWLLAAAAAGVTASLFVRTRYLNAPRPLGGGLQPFGEPGEADELLGSEAEQERPGAYSERRGLDADDLSGLGRS